jgi:hypothetical protein
MIARVLSTAAVAVTVQLVGLAAIAVGAGLIAGLGVGILTAGVLGVTAGVALERGADARKPGA